MRLRKRGLIIAVLVAAMLTGGCGKKESAKSNGTLTYWAEFNNMGMDAKNFGELPPFKKLMEETGVNIKFLHPVNGMGTEQFNVMLASGDYPDIIEANFKDYQGGPDQAIKDDVIISLNDVIEKYSPNFKKLMNDNPEMKKMCTTDLGTYYTYPAIYGDDYLQVYRGPIVRKDLLNKTGLKEPETIDEWTQMLTAFKELGVEEPLTMVLPDIYSFTQAYGAIGGLYVDNGKIKYGVIEPEYKKGIALLADWYQKGLLDRNMSSTDQTSVKTSMINGTSAAAIGATAGGIGVWMNSMKSDPDYNLVPLKYPVINKGDTPFYGHRINPVLPENGASISTACEDLESAAKVLDYAYGEKGILLFNFGIEGESYEMIDGYPTYTEKVTNDPAGKPMGVMINYYARPNGIGPSIRDKRYMEQTAMLPQQKESIEIWGKTDAKKHLLPPLTLSEQENEEVTAIISNLNSYVDAEILKFITGVRSMDEFDDFVNTVKGMNTEKYIANYQKAYDRYMRR